MKYFISLLSTCIVLSISSIDVNAQQRRAATRIASTEMEASPDERNRFIEGITMGSISSNKKERINSNSDKTVDRRERQLAAFDADEPVPTLKDKRNVAETIREGLSKNKSLYSFIQDWYGTPYRLGGTSRSAIDCSAFTRQLFSDVYGSNLNRTAAEQYASSKRVSSWDELKEGDLIFFSIKSKRITHVGVYLGQGKFVHASSSRGVMISDMELPYWRRYFAGGGKVK